MNRGGAYSTPSFRGGRSFHSSARASNRNRHGIDKEADGSNSSCCSSGGGTFRGRRGNGRYQFSPSTYARHGSYRAPGSTAPVYEYRVKKPSGDDAAFHTPRTNHFYQTAYSDATTSTDSKQVASFDASDSNSIGDSVSLPISLSSQDAQSDVTFDFSVNSNVPSPMSLSKLSLEFPSERNLQSQELSPNSAVCTGSSGNLENLPVVQPFDIFMSMTETHIKLKPSLLARNREKRNEIKRALQGQEEILGPGMVLLKGYLSIDDQVKIVNKCRNLGLGPGGFYQPGYQNGAKLLLKMMCLGKNWDPNTGEYGELRSIDGAKPPNIPLEFAKLVEKAMNDSIAFMEAMNEKDSLPQMAPDICIMNFYSASGRLGLHQDKDESEGSLKKGLPVVSFSIGDTGEFYYGDNRDERIAKRILLESGDVLIFGGKSRHIFHGMRGVHANTAPRALLDETNLRPGRLNLTFRKY